MLSPERPNGGQRGDRGWIALVTKTSDQMRVIFVCGGRRGMLLNNLNVGNGCKVSFDSEVKGTPRRTEENQGEERGREACGAIANVSKGGGETAEEGKSESVAATVRRGMVNVSGLRTKLTELCDDLSVRYFLPVCMYVCIHVCMYVCVYVCIY